MWSTLISSLFILYFLLYVLTTSCFDQTSREADFVKTSREPLAEISNPNQKSYVNTIHNKTGLVERRFILPGIISSTNVSVHNLGANVESFRHHIGHYRIEHSYDARMFYFFFESRGAKSDPVVLHLAGGPGESCALQIFYANGPFRINDDLSLKWNDFGWDKVSNLLFVDHLIGTGFSHSSDNRDIRRTTKEVVNDMYDFLQAFFQAHPEFINNEFYITGHSYAGHFIPALASRLLEENKGKEGFDINLKGIAIINGRMNQEYQYSSYLDFALSNKLISKSYYNELKISNIKCVKLIQRCQIDDKACMNAFNECVHNFECILCRHIGNGSINPYDIRKWGYTNVKYSDYPRKFPALDAIMTALNVENKKYVLASGEVFTTMIGDNMKNNAVVLPSLLENGIKVLIFDGEYDMRCNWLGHLRWLDSMKWSGRRQFLKSDFSFYKIDGKTVGNVIQAGSLTFFKVHDAGHSFHYQQPSVTLQVLKNWINGHIFV